MQKLLKNLAVLALLCHDSLVHSQDEKFLFDGPCPQFKPFDLDMNKLSDKPFQLLYGDKDSNDFYCMENKFTLYGDGKNTSQWQVSNIQRVPLAMYTDKDEDIDQLVNIVDNNLVWVLRDEDRENGFNNLGHIFSRKAL